MNCTATGTPITGTPWAPEGSTDPYCEAHATVLDFGNQLDRFGDWAAPLLDALAQQMRRPCPEPVLWMNPYTDERPLPDDEREALDRIGSFIAPKP